MGDGDDHQGDKQLRAVADSTDAMVRDLGVVPVSVVDEDCHRGQAVECGVSSPVIVGA
jgi:hypothetical protein